jgi:hypothetical protein
MSVASSCSRRSCSPAAYPSRTLDQLSADEAYAHLEQFCNEIARASSRSSSNASHVVAGMDAVDQALLADFVHAVSTTPPSALLGDDVSVMAPLPSSLLSPQAVRQFRYDSFDDNFSMKSPVVARVQQQDQHYDRKLRTASFASTMSIQLEDSVFDCEWEDCSDAFRSLDELCRHLQQEHLVHTQVPFHCMWRSCERHPNASATTSCQGMRTSAYVEENGVSKAPFRPFPKRNKLVMHVRTHTGERPFKCEECGRGFARADGLASHRKRHEVRATNGAPATNGVQGNVRGAGHQRGASLDAVHDVLNSPPCVIGGVGVWACRVCARRYTSLISARRHETQAHPEFLVADSVVDDMAGVIPVQDMLTNAGFPLMSSSMASNPFAQHVNPTPPAATWFGTLEDPAAAGSCFVAAPASASMDDGAWWAVAAERHFQTMMTSTSENAVHPYPQLEGEELDFLTPDSQRLGY